MIEKNEIIIASVDEIPEKVAQLLRTLAGKSRVWAFDAPMGAGKTTIIKEICRQLNVVDTVTSPTFSIVNEYKTTTGESIFHFDFYRIENISEALAIGIPDYLDSGNYCFIEWPMVVESILPDDYLRISITVTGNNHRLISW
ncbi:MAG TPA: tRNA (adenosine(37)-N6)-threonylcarbamoyltransferase complex ATPase subunit type 1 TsaE [Salinivirgaceae bacterium]|nr:tRNA (adenosine(37)-N6)-threonylcarbamoyltransferase complex ATPase subunit type 1 TsaE [Salinivirgaceae bacterium]